MDSSSSLKASELGKLVLSSGLLQSSWSKISELQDSPPNQESGLGIKIYTEPKHTLVVFVFVAPPQTSASSSSSTLLSGPQSQNPFHFLCSEKISSFSVLTPAYHLFLSAYTQNLKSKLLPLLESNKPLIITGANLGGSVASLFTLWLLETIDLKLKRPLCITFGSPLLGDASLQQILENSSRNSCFLNVVDAYRAPFTASFKPFGTFLLCFDSECICIEDPEAVMELVTCVDHTDLTVWRDYKEVLDGLDLMAESKLIIGDVMERMEARRKLRYDQLKKLNDMKISMVYIEWYKKKSKMANIGYYDRFKMQTLCPSSEEDIKIEMLKKELNEYWKALVEEVEKKPQGEKSILKTRCLFSGNNYRRLVEPLDIAEYYLSGKRAYRSRGRSRHYVMLEKWFKEEGMEPVRCERRDLSDLLTFDSCFWSEVEEASVVLDQLKTGMVMREEEEELMGKVLRFVEYVWEMIGKREVSPEIFLEKSSFIKWWKEYKEMNGCSNSTHSQEFREFMNSAMYTSYGQSH